MGINYANEKFTKATHALATSRGRIKQRLTDAITHHLINIDPARDIPDPEVSQALQHLITRATEKAPLLPGEGKTHASIQALTEDEAVQMAMEIMELASRVNHLRDA